MNMYYYAIEYVPCHGSNKHPRFELYIHSIASLDCIVIIWMYCRVHLFRVGVYCKWFIPKTARFIKRTRLANDSDCTCCCVLQMTRQASGLLHTKPDDYSMLYYVHLCFNELLFGQMRFVWYVVNCIGFSISQNHPKCEWSRPYRVLQITVEWIVCVAVYCKCTDE